MSELIGPAIKLGIAQRMAPLPCGEGIRTTARSFLKELLNSRLRQIGMGPRISARRQEPKVVFAENLKRTHPLFGICNRSANQSLKTAGDELHLFRGKSAKIKMKLGDNAIVATQASEFQFVLFNTTSALSKS